MDDLTDDIKKSYLQQYYQSFSGMTWAQYTQSVKEYKQEAVWDGRNLGARFVPNQVDVDFGVPGGSANEKVKQVCAYCGNLAHDHKGSGRCLACNAPL